MSLTPSLVPTSTIYEFLPEQINELLGKAIGAPIGSTVAVEYVIQKVGGDPMDRYPGTDAITKVRITVTPPKKAEFPDSYHPAPVNK